jgi:hypothetical protein
MVLLGFASGTFWGCSSNECDTVQACDIRKAACQQQTLEVLTCLRGGEGALPRIEVVDAGAFIAEQVGSAQAEPLPDEEVLLREALALFRLMAPATQPGEVEAEYWNGVAAFFSAEHRQVTILDRGSPLDEPGAVILLVHELVHALQAARLEGEPSGC